MIKLQNKPERKIYEIKLKGHLNESWADGFDGMTFTHEEDGTTTLTGEVVDQAALHGLLKKVRDLGLPLILVNQKENIVKRPFMLWPLVFCLLFLALGGFSGGIPMLADPANGGYLQFAHMLPLLPVSNFILPGLFLLGVMGFVPILLAYALIACPNWAWVEALFKWSKPYWAWTATLMFVAIIAIWLAYEGSLIGWFPITYATAIAGFFILLFALMPSVRKFYAR